MVDPRQQQWQKEKLSWVLGLVTDRFEEKPWYGWPYWYEGVSHRTMSFLDPKKTYRTIVYNTGSIPDYLDGHRLVHRSPCPSMVDCPGAWMGSGEVKDVECVEAPRYPEGTYQICPYCEQPLGARHGNIYIGHEWEEAVFQKGV